jgi:hypothetical protein
MALNSPTIDALAAIVGREAVLTEAEDLIPSACGWRSRQACRS